MCSGHRSSCCYIPHLTSTPTSTVTAPPSHTHTHIQTMRPPSHDVIKKKKHTHRRNHIHLPVPSHALPSYFRLRLHHPQSLASKFKSSVKSALGYKPKNQKSDVEKKYKLGKELGTGNFAVVRLGTSRSDGKKYAIKIIDKALCAGKEDMIDMELAVLRQADHAHLVGMKEYFDTPKHLYLVLDYVEGGELFDRIVDEGNFTERDASRIVRQMVEAIQYATTLPPSPYHCRHMFLFFWGDIYRRDEATPSPAPSDRSR